MDTPNITFICQAQGLWSIVLKSNKDEANFTVFPSDYKQRKKNPTVLQYKQVSSADTLIIDSYYCNMVTQNYSIKRSLPLQISSGYPSLGTPCPNRIKDVFD